MKYIRAEEGVYEVIGFDNECIIPSAIIRMNGRLTHCTPQHILKEADTIEELCDKFVTLSKYSNRHYEYLTLKGAINMRKRLPFEVCEIYGAIWTDKGLIYVAKMNEKGELELL